MDTPSTHRARAEALGQRLCAAAGGGDAEAVGRALDAGAEPGYFDAAGWTALLRVVADDRIPGRQRLAGVHRLLAGGADPNQLSPSDPDQCTVLLAAIRSARPPVAGGPDASLETIRALLAGGAAVGARSGDGSTALHGAAIFYHPGIAAVLIEAGAPLDAQDAEGRTALLRAATSPHRQDVAEALLAAGAKLDIADRKGWSPVLAEARFNNLAMLERLRQAGANMQACDEEGQNAPWVANEAACLIRLCEMGVRPPDEPGARRIFPDRHESRAVYSSGRVQGGLGQRVLDWWDAHDRGAAQQHRLAGGKVVSGRRIRG